jgi:hypothetical protein
MFGWWQVEKYESSAKDVEVALTSQELTQLARCLLGQTASSYFRLDNQKII